MLITLSRMLFATLCRCSLCKGSNARLEPSHVLSVHTCAANVLAFSHRSSTNDHLLSCRRSYRSDCHSSKEIILWQISRDVRWLKGEPKTKAVCVPPAPGETSEGPLDAIWMGFPGQYVPKLDPNMDYDVHLQSIEWIIVCISRVL